MGIHERKEREKEARRDEIINAAERVFIAKGVKVATMDDVAAEAELSKGTLYLYYRSKEDLFVSVASRGTDVLRRYFEEAISGDDPSIRRIVTLQEAFFRFFREHRDYFRMFYYFESPEFHTHVSPEVRDQCLQNDKKLWDLVIGVIRQAIVERMLHAGLNPAEVAIMLWASMMGFMRLIDREEKVWSEMFGVNLETTLRKANQFLLEAMMTPEAQRQYPNLLLHHEEAAEISAAHTTKG
jgi:AcrR family transcriptional regulator